MLSSVYDVAVIGAGPGGYVAAIRCAQLGLRTVIVDDWLAEDGTSASPGGTCLNVGCIPSKLLLEASENFERAHRLFPAQGIQVSGISIDLDTLMQHKRKVVRDLANGVAGLLRKNKVTSLQGHARLVRMPSQEIAIEVAHKGVVTLIGASHIILATGSKPSTIDGVEVDHERIVDNAGALSFKKVPRRLGVIGAGVIGLELGSVWRRFGADVTLIHPSSRFLASADQEIATEAHRLFVGQGLQFRVGASEIRVTKNRSQVVVEFQDDTGAQRMTFDRLIIAVGRSPNTDGLGCEEAGVQRDARGFISVDHECRTTVANIYAIGDVVAGPMLAHRASEQGVAVAEIIHGEAAPMREDTIPWVIYTEPEIAWVGQTEEALVASGIDYVKGVFPFAASGRAQTMQAGYGMVKILADRRTDRILGMHVLGKHASELIAQGVLAMEFAASSEDLARTITAHPSLSEAVHEAALGVAGRMIHR